MPKKWMREKAEMEKLLDELEFGYLGLSRDGKPYVIPISFAYKEDKIYLHTSLKGLKLEYLASNPQVCFAAAEQQELVGADIPCDYTVRYRSVVARGRGRLLTELNEKIAALDIIAGKYSRGSRMSAIDPEKADIAAVMVIEIEEMTGKYNIAG